MSTRLRWHQGMMYNNPIKSDIVIRFGDRTIHAHKSILMAGSGLFYTAFNSNFAIAQGGVYEIEGHEPDIVEHLLRSIYDDIPFIKNITPTRSPQEFAILHFMIANEYEVPRLGRAAAEYLVVLCGHHVRRSTIDGNHLTDLRHLLEEIAALYQDNAIADRSLSTASPTSRGLSLVASLLSAYLRFWRSFMFRGQPIAARGPCSP